MQAACLQGHAVRSYNKNGNKCKVPFRLRICFFPVFPFADPICPEAELGGRVALQATRADPINRQKRSYNKKTNTY